MSEIAQPAQPPEAESAGLSIEQQVIAQELYERAQSTRAALRATIYEQEQYNDYRRQERYLHPPHPIDIAGTLGLDVALFAIPRAGARAYRRFGVYRAVRAARKDYENNVEAYHQTALNEAGLDGANVDFAGDVAINVRRLRHNSN